MLKKFTLLLMCVLTAVSSAFADQLPREEWDKLTNFVPNPTTITTELPSKFYIRPKDYDNEILRSSAVTAAVTITTPDQGELEALSSTDSMTGSINIQFGKSFTTPGEYTLTIPAGLFYINNWRSDENLGTNPEVTITYTIQEPKPAVENPLLHPVVTPASGSQLRYIKDNVWVSFEGAAPIWNLACFSALCIKVECTEGVNKGNTYGVSYETPQNWKVESDGSINRNMLGIKFDQLISAPGTYVFTFYKGAFSTWVGDEQFYAPEFSATFYVVEAGEDEITLSVAKAVDPSNNSPINNFSKLHIEFPQCNPQEQGLLEGYEDYTNISLLNTTNNNIYHATDFSILDDLKTIEIRFNGNSITDNGEYILTVPAGIVRLKGTKDPIEYNQDLTFKYTLNFSLVDSVEETIIDVEVIAPVYDMMGRKVLENATKDDINNLPAGLYIFNGDKYAVK